MLASGVPSELSVRGDAGTRVVSTWLHVVALHPRVSASLVALSESFEVTHDLTAFFADDVQVELVRYALVRLSSVNSVNLGPNRRSSTLRSSSRSDSPISSPSPTSSLPSSASPRPALPSSLPPFSTTFLKRRIP